MASFTVLDISDKNARFIIDNVDLSIVNSVRRIILSEIPNVAFAFDPYSESNGIKIHRNTCALHNEFLAHRISLIPLCFDSHEIEKFEPSKYRFVLSKHNSGHESLNVTTADFDIYDENNVKYDKKYTQKIFPADPITKDHILITRLKPNLYDTTRGEEIDIECVAKIDIAKEHARWSPVSKCTFFNVIDEKKAKEVEVTVSPDDKNKFNYLDKYRYFKKNKYDEPSSFEFQIESECRLTPTYLFGKALAILKTQVETFASNLDKLEIQNLNKMNVINIIGSSHTLLNVLQALIYNANFRDKSPADNLLEFIGYHQSHPLDNKMVLKIKFKDNDTSVKEFLRQECSMISNYITELEGMWSRV